MFGWLDVLLIEWFQSTPPRGRRQKAQGIYDAKKWFQSTPPRGRRHDNRPGCAIRNRFQSTPPRGRRPENDVENRLDWIVSIHASAREATFEPPSMPFGADVSIHASAREATSNKIEVAWPDDVSIHASAREATAKYGGRKDGAPRFWYFKGSKASEKKYSFRTKDILIANRPELLRTCS